MAKDVAKHHFIALYWQLKKDGLVSSQKEFAEKLSVSPQSLTLVLDKENTRGVSSNLQNKAIEVFELDEDFFFQPVNKKDREEYQKRRASDVEHIKEILDRNAKIYEAQINLLNEKIERLQKENNDLKNKK